MLLENYPNPFSPTVFFEQAGIGSSYGDVAKAYRAHIDPESTERGKLLVAGSVYGGISFLFKSGKVSEIFLGVSAE